MTAYNRGQILYRVAELMEGRRAQFATSSPMRVRRTPRARSTPRSTAGSGTPGGPTRSRTSLGTSNPVAGPYFNFTMPEPTGVVGIVAPTTSRCSGWCRGWRRRSWAATPRWCWPASGRRSRRSRWPRCWPRSDVPGRRRQHPHRRHGRARAVARGPHGRQRDRPDGRARRAARPTTERAAAENVKRVHRAPGRRPVRRRGAEPLRDHGAHGVQDRLAPDGRVTGPGLDWREFSALSSRPGRCREATALSVRRGPGVPRHGPGGRRASAAPLLPGAR